MAAVVLNRTRASMGLNIIIFVYILFFAVSSNVLSDWPVGMAKKAQNDNDQRPSLLCVAPGLVSDQPISLYLPKDRAQQDLRPAVGVKVRPVGGGKRG